MAPVFDDEVVGHMGCCMTPSPAPDGNTYHSPHCQAKSYYKGKSGHKFNKTGYEKWRMVPRPATPSPDLPTWTGWVAPEGDFYSCDYAGHNYLAKQICLAKGWPTLDVWKNPDEVLEERGWVQVHGASYKEKTEHFIYLERRKFKGDATKRQLDTLFDLALKYDNMRAYDQFVEIYAKEE